MRFSAANAVFNLSAIGFGLSAFSLQKPPYPRRFSPPFNALSFTKERTEPICTDFALFFCRAVVIFFSLRIESGKTAFSRINKEIFCRYSYYKRRHSVHYQPEQRTNRKHKPDDEKIFYGVFVFLEQHGVTYARARA